MANLLIEIGNTAVKAAWAEGTVLGRTVRYQGERVMNFIASVVGRQYPSVLAVASVRNVSPEDQESLKGLCQHLLLLDPSHPGLLAEYGVPEFLSYDRGASLVAAKHMFGGKACTVFDLGTTLTVDNLAADGHYAGGAVSLGCRTRFKALNRYSRALPLVNMPRETAPAGDSVVSSIETGVISGIMFEIEGYIRSNPDSIVIFTGGDAIYFAKRMKNSIFVVCNLGLMGLAIITDEYAKKIIQ